MGMDFSECVIHNTSFHDLKAIYANLSGSRFHHVLFENCDLSKSGFIQCTYKDTLYQNCKLTESEFHNTDLNGIDFSTSDIDGISLSMEHLKGVIVNPSQAQRLVQLLGVIIKEEE